MASSKLPQKPYKKFRRTEVDFAFQNFGSICVLTPLTAAGRNWYNEHLPVDNPETQFWAGGIVLEPRYAGDILSGLQSDGLTVSQ